MRTARIALASGLVAAAAFFFATFVYVDKAGTISPRPSARMLTWSSAARSFANAPLFGKGLGADAANVKFGDQTLTDAHDLFLNVAAQAGFPGLAAICFLGLWFARRAFPMSLDTETDAMRTGLGIAFISAFFYQGLSGSFEDARHLWVLAGLLAASGESGRTDRTR